ncbi:MAG: hypothetical protein O7C66_05560, partial [Alphaproteobacteria bacterium]|nr:hypothetical protein [Alphaproteobacteria bacterium]
TACVPRPAARTIEAVISPNRVIFSLPVYALTDRRPMQDARPPRQQASTATACRLFSSHATQRWHIPGSYAKK